MSSSTAAKSTPKVVAKKVVAVVAAPAVVEAPKAAKKATAATATAAVVAPVAAAVETPKKSTKKAVAAVATTAVVVSSTPVEAAATAAPALPATTLDEDLKAVTGNLNTLRETVSAMLSQVKKLDKRVHREIKDARKRKRRSKAEEDPLKPRVLSIFERPTQVTDELCIFLGKPKGTLMSRSEVTKGVNGYVKEKDLKNKHDIKPDAALKKLLAIGDGEPLTYFNLQRYLNRHYIKAEKPAVAAVVVA